MVREGKTPLAPKEATELDRNILNTPFQNVDFDTHNTYGEHAAKELGAWEEYLHLARSSGEAPREENPFSYYLQKGPGRFYRAYTREGSNSILVAGFTIKPQDANFTLDSLYNIPDKSVAASAQNKLITKFFDEFSGATHAIAKLTIPREKLEKNPPLARAVFDFGLLRGSEFIIPMPGKVPVAPFRSISDEEKEKIRQIITEKKITGLLPYEQVSDAATLLTEEYYRDGVFVGKTITTLTENEEGEVIAKVDLVDADGKSVQVEKTNFNKTGDRVYILKTLAKNSSSAAERILG